MKRHAWLTLGLGLSAALVGCSGENSNDNGSTEIDGGIEDFSSEIKDLGKGLDGLGGDLDKLEARVKDLETESKCSEGQLCIPDGLDAVATGFDAIIDALCHHEVDCCSGPELNYKFGAAIKSVEQCKASFKDFVKRGYSPDFLTNEQVSDVVEVAHALSDPNVHVKLNPAGVKACAAAIKTIECPSLTEPSTAPVGCVAPTAEEPYPCAPEALLTGLEKAQDTCNVNSMVPECGEGLVCVPAVDTDSCSDESYGSCSQTGLCAPQPAVGDSCFNDYECGELFCDYAAGKCRARGKVGEACAYVDETFVNASSYPFNDNATKLDCEEGLHCDPTAKKCTALCSQGWVCYSDSECGDGLVCNRMANDALRTTNYGQCTKPIAEGKPCVTGTECASGSCAYDQTDARTECAPALKQPGAACTTAGYDATCSTGWCNTDLKCAALCETTCDDNEQNCTDSCKDTQYCVYEYTVQKPLCKQLVANGNTCESGHASCASGYCDPNNFCQPKVAKDAVCASTYSEQCQANQYCTFDGVAVAYKCKTAKPIGAACSLSIDECGPAANCWDTKGNEVAADYKCYTLEGDLPDGSYCGSEGDSYCHSGWCRYNANAYTCAPKIAVGKACDVDDPTKSECEDGTFCAYAEGSTAGTCRKLGTVGQACDPRFNGRDCLNADNVDADPCVRVRDSWLCNEWSIPVDTLMCDGK